MNRDCTDWFADYARLMFERLGDRVRMWSTHNEPRVLALLGYGNGAHAPGVCNSSMAYQVAHHLLLGHGKAVQVFRKGGFQGQIGIVLDLSHYLPASQSEADLAACRRVYLDSAGLFLEPLFHGHYPKEIFDWIGIHQPQVQDGDLELIHQPIDYLGVNHYFTMTVTHAVDGMLLKTRNEPYSAPGWGRTTMDWGINPQGLKAVLLDVKNNYGNPAVYIMENGCSLPDTPDEDGFVADWERVNYLRAHLQAVHQALQAGANLRGYFVWSLMDNFEWNWGYDRRFGLVHVDFTSQRRIPKQSAYWYRDVITDNAVNV
jgi:beta-glucosidase